MKKINSIKFKNFKAFYGEDKIQLDGKNLLIYGENGSGKSSIFWGLYTFLQSSGKIQKDIFKYFVDFDENNPETYDSLKNIFSSDIAFIELATLDTISGTITTDRIDSISSSTDVGKNNQMISLANASSDFINYKLLHNFYNVTHKQEINLWQVFIRDIFPLFKNNEVEKYYAERIEELTKSSPKSSNGAKSLKVGSRPQVEYVQKIDDLNRDIDNFLIQIEQNANQFLKNQFFDGDDVLQIFLTYNVKIDYDSVKDQEKSKYSICLNLKLWDPILTIWKEVKRPHSFLNEAQLTRVAIAVRIGALQTRIHYNEYKILCLDDMLISLDMGNRDKVIQTFLNTEKRHELEFFDKFQKIIFTHDKAFYNLCKQRIRLSLDENEWYFKEIYLDTDLVPQRPFIDNSTDYFQRAEKHLKAFDYPASANALRQGLENLLFNFIPDNSKLQLDRTDKVTSGKQFNDLLDKLKNIHKEHHVSTEIIDDLFVYKDHLLNPFSHDNLYTQVYKQEIESLLKLIPKLKVLNSVILKEAKDKDSIIKLIDNNSKGVLIEYHIYMKENLIQYTLLDGKKYLNKCDVIVLKSIDGEGKEIAFGNVYGSLNKCLNRLAKFLDKTYLNEDEMLEKLKLE
ncbi:AAA family ATPase [Sphingobacterium faecium]|uniref:AAA family ATPase n=1 Tax=Sphingobacterium faecium TaxID=34087 RepID=UPI0032093AB0